MKKKALILGPLALIAVFLLVTLGRVWWFRGYSKGTRTGVVRKMSVKGPPYCKYISGEMVLQGGAPGQPQELWEFSVDGDDNDQNPLMVALKGAERSSEKVTLAYRQDLHSLYRCTPSEYFITGIEK